MFDLNLSTTADVDQSVVQEFDAEFRVSLAEQGVMSQFTSIKKDISAKSISLPKYEQLSLGTTPLVETDEVASEKMIDDAVILTPLEYGKAVTTTKLASLQTSGMADRAAAKIVGINAGRSDNRLASMALDASLNRAFGGTATSTATLAAGDIMTGSLMNKMYNKLSRESVLGVANGEYVMVCHEDVIFDIRESSGAGSWQDANKYAQPSELLRNEVGMYKGFRVIRDNLSTVNIGAGATGEDVYSSYFVGFNALGKAISQPMSMRASGPFDKLSRFVSLGWYQVAKWGIVETKACYVAETTSNALL